jgi:DNA-binding NarL/FixJ family response regulator
VFQNSLVWQAIRGTVPAPIRRALAQEVGAPPEDEDRGRPEPPPPAADDAPGLSQLSAGERTIAEMVSAGLTNRQIAAQVYLSPHTVNYHLRRIFRKLNIASRVELAMLAKSNDG